jgi:uncharacterized membrane protein
MNNNEILESEPPDSEDKHLIEMFDKIEAGQLDLLDAAGKRIIELVTGLLGVLLAVLALGQYFPPPYLNNPFARLLAILALIFYLLAMLAGMWVMQPRKYRRFTRNLSALRQELDQIIDDKSRALRWAGAFFFAGSVCLALLITTIILSQP